MRRQLSEKRLLIVDDESHIAIGVAMALRKQYRVVDTANSGFEAINMLKRQGYDLVLTDYRMPDMNGVELGTEIRHIAPQTQVMLMTAYSSEMLQESAESTLDGFINKPFSFEQIRQIIGQAVNRVKEAEAEEREKATEPLETGDAAVFKDIQEQVKQMQVETGARCVLLLKGSGIPITYAGSTTHLDVPGISTLVAANFMAAAELARLLGNDSVFKSSFHEGADYDIYSFSVADDWLLATIFGSESKTGLVRFVAQKKGDVLADLLANFNTKVAISDDMRDKLQDELDQLL